MKKAVSLILVLVLVLSLGGMFAADAFAAEDTAAVTAAASAEAEEKEGSVKSSKAIAAAVVVGVVAAAGAVGMALAISKSVEGMARQPEAADKINSAMMLGLVFIETAIIYALIVAILVIFVL